MNNLVIVESPAKAKTIEKYLGKGFKVLASYGHIRDLVSKNGAVDTDNAYAMKYEEAEDKQKHISAIASALQKPTHSIWQPTRTGKEKPFPGISKKF